MKHPLLLWAALILLPLSAFCQTPSTDTGYYAQLKTGEIVHARKIRLRHSDTADKYLILDKNPPIPIDQISRFRSNTGTYVTVPGSAGTDIYHVDKEGSRISLYSRILIIPNDSGYTQTRRSYFRKTNEEKMHPANYASLNLAMSDNPASQQQLHIGRTNITIGLAILIPSLIVEALGIAESLKKTPGPTPPLTMPTFPINPNNPPQPPPLPTYTSHFSPLVVIGAAGLTASIIFTSSGKSHEKKAYDLYNAN